MKVYTGKHGRGRRGCGLRSLILPSLLVFCVLYFVELIHHGEMISAWEDHDVRAADPYTNSQMKSDRIQPAASGGRNCSQYETELSMLRQQVQHLKRHMKQISSSHRVDLSSSNPLEYSSRIDADLIIGIKTFRRPRCLWNAVKSLLMNGALQWPIVVVDDGNDSVSEARVEQVRPGTSANSAAGEDMFLNLVKQNVHSYIYLPYDSGVSAGRNFIVEFAHHHNVPYVFIMDDDYSFEKISDIGRLLRLLQQHPAVDIAAPVRCDYSHGSHLVPKGFADQASEVDKSYLTRTCGRSYGKLSQLEADNRTTTLAILPFPSPLQPVDGCIRTELVQQVFAARVETLRRSLWDTKLKNNDHYDFLLNAKQNGLAMVTCPDTSASHRKFPCFSTPPSHEAGAEASSRSENASRAAYHLNRSDRWRRLAPYVMNKWSLGTIVDEVGKEIRLVANGSSVSLLSPSVTEPSVGDVLRDSIASMAISAVNAGLPGWEHTHVLVVYLLKWSSWLTRSGATVPTPMNACLSRVETQLIREFSAPDHREQSKMSARTLVAAEVLLANPSCAQFVDELTVVENESMADSGNSSTSFLFIVTTVKDDGRYLERFLEHVVVPLAKASFEDHIPFVVQFVVADFGSNDVDVSAVVGKTNEIIGQRVLSTVSMEGQFSRSYGLDQAIRHAETKLLEGAIAKFFAVDTSVTLPRSIATSLSTVLRGIWELVQCGHTIWSPIVSKVHRDEVPVLGAADPESEWRYAGYGMIGMCLSDYRRAGGYNVDAYGVKYGGEDIDLVVKLQKIGLHVLRLKELPGTNVPLFHARDDKTLSPERKEYRSKSNRNTYSGQLPITPECTVIGHRGGMEIHLPTRQEDTIADQLERGSLVATDSRKIVKLLVSKCRVPNGTVNVLHTVWIPPQIRLPHDDTAESYVGYYYVYGTTSQSGESSSFWCILRSSWTSRVTRIEELSMTEARSKFMRRGPE